MTITALKQFATSIARGSSFLKPLPSPSLATKINKIAEVSLAPKAFATQSSHSMHSFSWNQLKFPTDKASLEDNFPHAETETNPETALPAPSTSNNTGYISAATLSMIARNPLTVSE